MEQLRRLSHSFTLPLHMFAHHRGPYVWGRSCVSNNPRRHCQSRCLSRGMWSKELSPKYPFSGRFFLCVLNVFSIRRRGNC